MANNNQIYKMSNAGGFKSLTRYYDMLAGNTTWNPWEPQGAFDALATVTVDASAPTEVIFTGIPQTYKHLQIRLIARQNSGGTSIDNCTMQVNGVTSGSLYASHFLRGNGSSATSTGYGSLNNWSMAFWAPQTNSGAFGGGIIDILDYASTTKNKTFRGLSGVDTNGAGELTLASGLFNSTAAITSIRLFGATFGANTQFALYGVK